MNSNHLPLVGPASLAKDNIKKDDKWGNLNIPGAKETEKSLLYFECQIEPQLLDGGQGSPQQ